MFKIEKIVIISSLRMLLIFLLLNKTKLDNIYFVFENVIIKSKNIKKMNVYSEKNILKRFFKYFLYYFKLIRILPIFQKKDKIEIYGADHVTIADFFLKKYNFYLLEDGIVNYSKIAYKRSLKNKIFSVPKYGRYKSVKKIYLTGLAPIPEEIKNKVEIIDLKKLWKLKIEEEQQKILEIFGFNNNLIKELKEKNIILFTQPLSEDGILNEQEKVELYSKIILKYPKEKLIIKTHPREKTNYSKIFNEICILEQNFPAEIFNLLDISFKKGVTLFSTAVLTNNCKEIDFYGTEVHPKLLKKFGSMDYIMKRNKFLEENSYGKTNFNR